MLVFLLCLIVVLLIISGIANKWLSNQVNKLEKEFKSLYNFHAKLCFSFKSCPNNGSNCKFCLQSSVILFKLWKLKVYGVCIHNIYNGIPDINLKKLQDYLDYINWRVVTKFENGNKSFVKDGIVYDAHSTFKTANVVIYIDEYNVSFTIQYLNDKYNKDIDILNVIANK